MQNFYDDQPSRCWSFDERDNWNGVSPFSSEKVDHVNHSRRLTEFAKTILSKFRMHQRDHIPSRPPSLSDTDSDLSCNGSEEDLERGRIIHVQERRWSFDDRDEVSWRGLSPFRDISPGSSSSHTSTRNTSQSQHGGLRKRVILFLGSMSICGLGRRLMRKKLRKRYEATENTTRRAEFELRSAGVAMPTEFRKWAYAKRELNDRKGSFWAKLWGVN